MKTKALQKKISEMKIAIYGGKYYWISAVGDSDYSSDNKAAREQQWMSLWIIRFFSLIS